MVAMSAQGQRTPGRFDRSVSAVELESAGEADVNHGEISGYDDVWTVVDSVGQHGEVGEAAVPGGRVLGGLFPAAVCL